MQNEVAVRGGAFLLLFVLFAGLETLAPRCGRNQPRGRRWGTNLTLTVLNTVALRGLAFLLPLLAIGAALDAQRMGWGLFNLIALPYWLVLPLSVLILDLCIWAQHLVTHKVPLFWRFHRVHHADRDMDVTTGLRFHPLEILGSMLVKIGLIYLLGPPALAVLVFEVILNGTSLFNHANLALPGWLDRAVRLIMVTPDMHRIHHSTQRADHDSNYGFALSFWDRIFGTYRSMPEEGEDRLVMGLEWQDERPARLTWALWLPFRR
jgi:sterol desaturase/sphingolipid hydroxylase (fatty acid hydroxylase superfamily)